MEIETGDLYLVYRDDQDNYHYQPWEEIDSTGNLIDPESGEPYEIVGWSRTAL